MATDNSVAVELQLQTPIHRNGPVSSSEIQESISQMQEFLSDLFGGAQFDMKRLCDKCNIELEMVAEDLDFECDNCHIKFDLCTTCQEPSTVNHCPPGYGCEDSNN